MADQNSSNNGRRPNSSSDAIDESHILTELERIGARAGRRTAQRGQLEERIRGEGKLLNKLIDEGQRTPIIREGPFYEEQVSGLRESIRGIRGRMNSLDVGSQTRAESEASTAISRQFSPASIGSQAANMQRQSAIQNRAFSMAGQSYDDLSARREDVLASIRTTERGALNEVKGMYGRNGQVDPEKSAALGVMFSGTQGHVRELATITAAQQMQKMSGNDPTSKLNKVIEMGKAATIAEEIRSGGINISSGGQMKNISTGDIGAATIEQSRILANALKELAEGVSKTDDELAKLRSTAEESAENLDKLQRAGGGGGGYSGSQVAGAAAGAFTAAGGAIQQIAVSQRLGQVANIAGFAGIENQKYGMYSGARGGDVMSQMLLSQYGSAQKFGRELKTGQQAAVAAYTAAGVLQTTAGGLQIAEGSAQKANPLAYASGASTQNTQAIISGGQNVVQGLSTTATNTFDLARGVSTNAAAIQGTQADMEARRALLQVSATQLQGFRDLSVGVGTAAIGMGRAGGAFIEQNTSASGVQAMIDARMSPEQFAQLSQTGVGAMGSMFSTSQTIAARGLERSGFGTAQENMQRMSTLAAGGSNNPQAGLASVMETALKNGLDSSRALTLITENTAAMAGSSTGAAMGLDTSAASASMLGAAADPTNPNREFAVQRAASASELARTFETNTAVSFSGMVNTARIGKATGLSGTESILAQQLDTQTLRTMQGKSGDEVSKMLRKQGIDVPSNKAGNTVDTLLDLKAMSLLEAGGAGISQNVDSGALLKRIRSGKLADGDDKMLGTIAGLSGFKGGSDELMRQVQKIYTPVNSGTGKEVTDAMAGKGGSNITKDIDDLRTSGFKQLSEQAFQATDSMKKFGGALQTLIDMNKDLEKFGAEGGEAKFADAAAASAETFGKSTVLFEKAVGKFSDKIDTMMKNSGLGRDVPGVDSAVKDMSRRSGG